MTTLSIVVCGWHFRNLELYGALSADAKSHPDLETRCFVASHRPLDEVSTPARRAIDDAGWEIVPCENAGWDWGAFQQFARWQAREGSATDYYLFLHDDIVLRSSGLIDALFEKAAAGARVVGNAAPMRPDLQIAKNFPEDLLWASNQGFEIRAERWNAVRGSCVFADREVVERVLMDMPIKHGQTIELANSSLRIFAGLVADAFGLEATAYLSSTPRESDWIAEEERGGVGLPFKRAVKQRLKRAIPKQIWQGIQRARGFTQVERVGLGTGLKVNLGSGMESMPGYFNVDKYSPIADLRSDIFDLKFDDCSVAEVLMVHVIEHIEIDSIVPLFETIRGWLRPGGQLIMEFPDLIKCCNLILEMADDPEKLQTSHLGVQGLFGGNPKTSVYDLHKWGWTGSTMKPLLLEAGFSEVHVEHPRFHVHARDTRVVAIR